jgi:integrase
MASNYLRRKSFWLQCYHPLTGEPIRESLQTADPARADLVTEKLNLHLELLRPEFLRLPLPPRFAALIQELGGGCDLGLGAPASVPPGTIFTTAAQMMAAPIEEVLSEYVAYIRLENDDDHVSNKLTHLKRLFGCRLLGIPGDEQGIFNGATLMDVKIADVRRMIDALPVGKKTKKHHRETFHNLFEFAMKYNFFTPINFRYPNPMSALPSYNERNRCITFLKGPEVDQLLKILEPFPSVRMAVALMIHGALRRAEALWLTRSCISPDLRFFSVVNKIDSERDLESSLKTGERAVPIIPALKPILEDYLEKFDGEWLVPSPTGIQWNGDNFGDKHREILRANELNHTCLIYRHTFATARAAEGWPLFKIAKIMGNSVAVCEEFYAAYIDPGD